MYYWVKQYHYINVSEMDHFANSMWVLISYYITEYFPVRFSNMGEFNRARLNIGEWTLDKIHTCTCIYLKSVLYI